MVLTYRYGEPRNDNAFRIGVARYAPRGVRHEDYRRKNYLDLWLPALAPSPGLIKSYRDGLIDFRKFAARYRTEMKRPESRQLIDLVALLSRSRLVSLGCYCEEENRCHRSVLRALVIAAESGLPAESESRACASPPCFAGEDDS